jgi:2,3-bisphosphoglycerate-independent phosphoglycerate mutase
MPLPLKTIQALHEQADSRIVLLVMDGLGGMPEKLGGPTELEAAHTPNLDGLVHRSICGLHEPVGTGITPGSGPGHLALFGYAPTEFEVGRGVLSALGSDFDLTERDVAARGNFCTIDEAGEVTDRRAGRISTDKSRALCELLREIELPGVELFVEPVKEHRFLLVLRGDDLGEEVADTDPQQTGAAPLAPRTTVDSQAARKTVELVAQFADQARQRLADHHPANMVLLRGFAKLPDWPRFPEVFGLRAAALADYPMYRGVAKLVGMQALETGASIEEKVATARQHWNDYDFFFMHHKKTDSTGEDGDFDAKVAEIEKVDAALPAVLDLNPDVIVVTGDHSTPAKLGRHSWHPVPVLLHAPTCRPDKVDRFSEVDCVAGALGPRLAAADLLPLALAHANRLGKFGA